MVVVGVNYLGERAPAGRESLQAKRCRLAAGSWAAACNDREKEMGVALTASARAHLLHLPHLHACVRHPFHNKSIIWQYHIKIKVSYPGRFKLIWGLRSIKEKMNSLYSYCLKPILFCLTLRFMRTEAVSLFDGCFLCRF